MRTPALIAAAAGAALFAAGGVFAGAGALTLVRLALLGAALAAVVVYDLSERRIPNRLVLPADVGCAAVTLGAGAGLALLAGIAVVVALLAISLARPRALGMGDVKLALLIVLGLDGDALRALALGLVFAALAGLALLVRHGRGAWGASLPLAPFLAAGALLAVVA